MTEPTATLLLPAALPEPDWLGADRIAAAAARPAWATLARRARISAEAGPQSPPPSDPGHERWLHARLGLPDDASLAACAAHADARPDVAWRVDPVHLHVGRDHLVLTEPAALALSADDAHALAASVAPLFADDGLALEVPSPSRWYLRELDGSRPLRLRTRSLTGAAGRNVDAWLPTGDDARRWRRLGNEVQMTWHDHPVNQRRDARGLPSVNSLWIDGRCPPAGAMSSARLAAAARIAARGATDAARDAGPDAARDGSTSGDRSAPGATPADAALLDLGDGLLAIDDRLLDAHLAGDPMRWADAWAAIDAGVLSAILRGEPPWRGGARIVLAGDAGWRALDVAPRADWRFWRRADPLALLAEPADPPAAPRTPA